MVVVVGVVVLVIVEVVALVVGFTVQVGLYLLFYSSLSFCLSREERWEANAALLKYESEDVAGGGGGGCSGGELVAAAGRWW